MVRLWRPGVRPYEDLRTFRYETGVGAVGSAGIVGAMPRAIDAWGYPGSCWVERGPMSSEYSVMLFDPASIRPANAMSVIETYGTPVAGPAWRRTTSERLSNLLGLPDDWDSNGSGAPSLMAAIEALSLLERVLGSDAVAPSVVPLSDGGVQLEWHRRGTDVEVILGPVDDRGIFVEDTNGVWEGSVDDSSDVVELARRLTDVAAAAAG
ncbi:hypothetical protein [Solirubrobacter ginsenosidimutans]|nr:hypothetical protein [Solirubrobacter ginsenosidimutans]